MEGFYHDCSLLFDDDDRVYIVYGNRNIHLTELKEDLSGPKPGGLDRIVVKDAEGPFLGYEGTHFYKIKGKYYLFFIHSLQNEWKRTEACFVSDSLDGEFVGGDVLNDDMGYCNSGVAQGGIVDTPDGKWYAILFQDRGAVGRIPVLVPMTWENDYPVLGVRGRVPLDPPARIMSTSHWLPVMILNLKQDFLPKQKQESMAPLVLRVLGSLIMNRSFPWYIVMRKRVYFG